LPFRVFGGAVCRQTLPSWGHALGIRYPFRVPGPTKYRSYWFRDPTMPLAIPSAAWFSFAGLRRPQLSNRCTLSAGFAFLQSLTALPSRPIATSQHLSWAFVPYSTCGTGSPLVAGLPHPLRSAFRVWLPSGRLPPSGPLPALFHAGSAHGIRPSELSPPERYPPRFRRDEPTCRFARR